MSTKTTAGDLIPRYEMWLSRADVVLLQDIVETELAEVTQGILAMESIHRSPQRLRERQRGLEFLLTTIEEATV